MYSIVDVISDYQCRQAHRGDQVELLGHAVLKRHGPSAHYHLRQDDVLLARCSIWSDSTPTYQGKPAGVIGHFAAADASVGTLLLLHAAEQLRLRGFPFVIGPMDGNTWRSYRLLSDRRSEPVFFLEPDNPDDWPTHFLDAGFLPIAQYSSALNDNLSILDPRVPRAVQRLKQSGISIRQMDITRFDQELQAVHQVSVKAFADNFLYTAVTQSEFLQMYAPVKPHIRPELVLLAEKDAQLVGFIFAMPDLLQVKSSGGINTVIAKTVAVLPGKMFAGLGSVLVDQLQQAARQLGYTRVIHALMHQNNTSRNISARFGKSIRGYTLYGKEMGS